MFSFLTKHKKKRKATGPTPVGKNAVKVITPGSSFPDGVSSDEESNLPPLPLDSSSSSPIMATSSTSSDTAAISDSVTSSNNTESSSAVLSVQSFDNTSSTQATNENYPTNQNNSDTIDSEANKKPKKYMTKKRKVEAKKKEIDDKKLAYKKACDEYQQGKFKSIREASKHYNLSYSCLHRYLVHGDEFGGQGRKSQVLTEEEEQKIVDHVIYRQKIGCGMTYYQLQLLIQEVLVAVTSNPLRTSPYADKGHFPHIGFARRLADRNNLTLRATMEISKGRQINGVDELVSWQMETEAGLVNLEKFKDCFKDGSRIFNQDETSIQVGSSGKVLAERGTKVLYNVGGSSREHITASYTVSASGNCVPVRLVYKGVRNVANQHLKDLPTNGRSGAWKFGVTPNGYVTRESYMDILQDLDTYLEQNDIIRPVILFMDGPNAHISLEAAQFCKLKKIQPWILRANMTHLLQPLDLTFFCSLKKKLNQLGHLWQADPNNAGQALSKYTVMKVLYNATEDCLSNTSLIPNGFKRAGIFPWDPSAPDRTKLLPSSIYRGNSIPDNNSIPATNSILATNSIPDESSIPTDSSNIDNNSSSVLDNSFPTLSQEYSELAPLPTENIEDPMETSCSEEPNRIKSVSHPPPMNEIPISSSSRAVTGDLSDNIDFEPSLTSSFIETNEGVSKPYWYAQTKLCPSCSRRILSKFFSSHIEVCCGSPNAETEVPTIVEENSHGDTNSVSQDVKLSSIPIFSLEERKEQLEKFEVLLLKKNQVKEFNELFMKKQYSVKEPLYSAWLNLKFASVGTEADAINYVLNSKIAKNVPKRKTVRKDFRPKGPPRHDPTSAEWQSVLIEQQQKNQKSAKKRKPADSTIEEGGQAKKKKSAQKKNSNSE